MRLHAKRKSRPSSRADVTEEGAEAPAAGSESDDAGEGGAGTSTGAGTSAGGGTSAGAGTTAGAGTRAGAGTSVETLQLPRPPAAHAYAVLDDAAAAAALGACTARCGPLASQVLSVRGRP